MHKNTKLQVLEYMDRVFSLSEGCKLLPAVFEKAGKELGLLSEYFKVSNEQAFFIALVFSLQYKQNQVDLAGLTEHCACSPLKILAYSDELEALETKGMLVKRKNKQCQSVGHAADNHVYFINQNIIKALMHNQPVPLLKKGVFGDALEVLEHIHVLVKQREDGELSGQELSEHLPEIVKDNLRFPLVKQVAGLGLPVADLFIYLQMIWGALSGMESLDLDEKVGLIIESPAKQIRYIQQILSGENTLIKQRLAELEEAVFFNETSLVLTDHSKEILRGCGLKLFVNKKHKENIISHAGIRPKMLFYNEEEAKQLRVLENLMEDSSLTAVRKRLSERNLPQGVAALFYGAPGTGKTEMAMQLARQTGRDIMKVNISQIKSMWFGESEKNIKRLFTDYKAFREECHHIPILLFNEADAVLSKRKPVDSALVTQTENTMQNIILEEMESFEGMMIATTNLTCNLDAAFERRFLFKIHFQKPGLVAQSKIWKLKLPALTIADCVSLASEFDFTGGQIDNVARKFDIWKVLYGLSPDTRIIENYCREELMSDRRLAIGFTKS